MSKGTISLVIPALNEERGIEATIRRVPKEVTEVIVVDGASADATVERARAAGAKVIIEPKRGYGLAYRRGFEAATGDIIATADADGTYPTEMIPIVAEYLERKRLWFVNCSRFPLSDARSMRSINKLGNIGMSLFATALYFHPFRDIASGMWVFRRDILERMELHTQGWEFSNEIKLEAFFLGPQHFGEFVVPYDERVGETHNQTIWRTGSLVLGFMAYERFRHFIRGRVIDPRASVRSNESEFEEEPSPLSSGRIAEPSKHV
jgi:glycosyltransferase involved in cell wall biosynthesis